MAFITRFTRAQYRESGETQQRWQAIGCSTRPINQLEVLETIRSLYESEGFRRPKVVIVASPPLALMTAVALGWPHDGRHLGPPLFQSMVWNGDLERPAVPGPDVYRCLREQVGDDCLRDDVDLPYAMVAGTRMWRNLYQFVRQGVLDNPGIQNPALFWPGLCENLRQQLKFEPADVPPEAFVDAAWLRNVGRDLPLLPGSWHAREEIQADYLRRIGVRFPAQLWQRLALWLRQDEVCHWWLAFENIAILCDRPRTLHLDLRGRLHCDTGPALAYSDGCRIYALDGVRVPESMIETPDNVTVRMINRERNTEVRRLMLDQYGMARYLKRVGAWLVHQDQAGKLWRFSGAFNATMMVVEVVNSTPEPDGTFKTYFLQVPPDMSRATDAVAWTFELAPADYRPLMET